MEQDRMGKDQEQEKEEDHANQKRSKNYTRILKPLQRTRKETERKLTQNTNTTSYTTNNTNH